MSIKIGPRQAPVNSKYLPRRLPSRHQKHPIARSGRIELEAASLSGLAEVASHEVALSKGALVKDASNEATSSEAISLGANLARCQRGHLERGRLK